MSWRSYSRHQKFWEISFWVLVGLVYIWSNASSVLADYERLGLDIAAWQPWTWEISSWISGLLLIPLILRYDTRFSLTGQHPLRSLGAHLIFSVIFSVCHVTGMVLIRKLVYFGMGEHYDFGYWPSELIYEYRKDVITYAWILAVIYIYRFISTRLRGEAKVIATGEDVAEPRQPERLLVKKLGKEFIIKVADIHWIEAAGNYMNLHIDNRVYPLRETMAGLEKRLNPKQFVRIHRSFMVNLDQIEEVQPLDTGDYKIRLKGGQELNFSRRYREKVKGLLT